MKRNIVINKLPLEKRLSVFRHTIKLSITSKINTAKVGRVYTCALEPEARKTSYVRKTSSGLPGGDGQNAWSATGIGLIIPIFAYTQTRHQRMSYTLASHFRRPVPDTCTRPSTHKRCSSLHGRPISLLASIQPQQQTGLDETLSELRACTHGITYDLKLTNLVVIAT
jgi:hypothetical protein